MKVKVRKTSKSTDTNIPKKKKKGLKTQENKPKNKKKAKTNPNKVNQYTDPDPRQALFLEYYFDRDGDTFSSVIDSGLKAGFTEEYSKTLLSKMPKWLSSVVRQSSIVQKAERNLDQFMDDDDSRIKADMTKFALKTIGKDKGYTERQEVAGENGGAIKIEVSKEAAEKYNLV